MIKTFTVHAIHHKEISPGKGSIIWLLSDEKGLPRKINGITTLDAQGVIESIQPVYKRERPLIKRLYNTEKSDVFTVDFSAYNEEQNYVPREVYGHMRSQEKVAGLAGHVIRASLMLGAVALIWFAYTAFMDISDISQHISQ